MFKVDFSRLMTGLCRTVAIAAIGGAAAFSTTPASAQIGDAAGFADLMRHDYLHRDIVLFSQGLDMDDGQRVIVESLYEDYRDEFDEGWLATQEQITGMLQDVKSATPQEAMDMVMRPFEEWRKEKEQIKQRFEENVKVILNREQLQQWPAFQRQMRREKTLHLGRLSGESVDLFHIVRDLQLHERIAATIESVMDQYSLTLDEALRRRNELLNEVQGDLMRSIRAQEATITVEKLRQQVERRVALRNVNDHYIDVIASSLPMEHGEEFRESALESAYPRVYRPLPAQRIYNAAKELEELDEETLEAIHDLETIMMAEFEGMNADLHEAIRDHEPKALLNQMEIFTARTRGEEVTRLQDPTHEQIRARDDRASYYVALLRELLTPEQFTSLPGYSRWMSGENRRTTAQPQRPGQGRDAQKPAGEMIGNINRGGSRGGGRDTDGLGSQGGDKGSGDENERSPSRRRGGNRGG